VDWRREFEDGRRVYLPIQQAALEKPRKAFQPTCQTGRGGGTGALQSYGQMLCRGKRWKTTIYSGYLRQVNTPFSEYLQRHRGAHRRHSRSVPADIEATVSQASRVSEHLGMGLSRLRRCTSSRSRVALEAKTNKKTDSLPGYRRAPTPPQISVRHPADRQSLAGPRQRLHLRS